MHYNQSIKVGHTIETNEIEPTSKNTKQDIVQDIIMHHIWMMQNEPTQNSYLN